MTNGLFNYILNNPIGSNRLGTNNLLPAGLLGIGNILQNRAAQSSYALYEKQANDYIAAALENAEIIRNKGAIALQTLQEKNKQIIGSDIATISARGYAGTKMSGSNLDVMLSKMKAQAASEAMTQNSTLWAASNEIRNGYRQAASTYATLENKATSDKYNALLGILQTTGTYLSLQSSDALKIQQLDAQRADTERALRYSLKEKEDLYGNKFQAKDRGTDLDRRDFLLSNNWSL